MKISLCTCELCIKLCSHASQRKLVTGDELAVRSWTISRSRLLIYSREYICIREAKVLPLLQIATLGESEYEKYIYCRAAKRLRVPIYCQQKRKVLLCATDRRRLNGSSYTRGSTPEERSGESDHQKQYLYMYYIWCVFFFFFGALQFFFLLLAGCFQE